MWPKTLAPAIIKTEEQEFVDLIETRALERMIEEARLQWHYYVPPKPELDVEHDIWVQLPPKREFTLNVQIEYQGRAKPAFFVDWVEDDE
jgi:hypothetical protein